MDRTDELTETCYGTKPSTEKVEYIDRPYEVVKEKVVYRIPWGDIGTFSLIVGGFIVFFGGIGWLTSRPSDYACNDLARDYTDLVGLEKSGWSDEYDDGAKITAKSRDGACYFKVQPNDKTRPEYNLSHEYVEMAIELATTPGGPPSEVKPEVTIEEKLEASEKELEKCSSALEIWKR